MAKINFPFDLNGPLGDFSFYRMAGEDKIIMRRKGGPSKQKVKTAPTMEGTRRSGSEFGGRSSASKWMRVAFGPLGRCFERSTSGRLNKWLAPIQQLDQESDWGQRHVLLSQAPRLLEGFQFKEQGSFDTIIKNPLSFRLSKESLSAEVDIPTLLPGINFALPGEYPFCKITAVLGVMPDLFFDEAAGYRPRGNYSQFFPSVAETPWFTTRENTPSQSLELSLTRIPENNFFSLVLTVGIQFATAGRGGGVVPLKRTANARILAAG